LGVGLLVADRNTAVGVQLVAGKHTAAAAAELVGTHSQAEQAEKDSCNSAEEEDSSHHSGTEAGAARSLQGCSLGIVTL
jgi:hypothetical protein